MKKITTLLILILIFSMLIPVLQTKSNLVSDPTNIGSVNETQTLAATPGYEVTVIRVGDDAPVSESTPDTNYELSYLLDCSNASGDITRSWLKFDLTHIPSNLQFSKATVNLFTVSGVGSVDYPRGIFRSDNDSWTESTITWNNQPEYSLIPADVIDSPASPDMFDVGFWYEWEITEEVIQTVREDGILSLVLAFEDEGTTDESNLAFSSREYAITLGDSGFHVMPHISIEYAVPITSDLMVDGFSESPEIDYIRSENPDFSWSFNDLDLDDFQKNFELEVWNNPTFDDTLLMQKNNSEIVVVHDTGAGLIPPGDAFNAPYELRFQYKWPSSMIPKSGTVDKLMFEMDKLSGTTTYSDLAIYMISVEDSGALTTDFEANYDGGTPIQVLNRTEFTGITRDGFMIIDIENTFVVSPSLDLIIEFRHTGASGTIVNCNYTVSGGSIAGSADPVPNGGAYYEATADATVARTHGLRLELVSTDVYSEGVSTNLIPFGLSLGTSGRFQFKYNQSLIDDEGVIDRILFQAGLTGDVTYENFSVYLVETPHEGALSHTDMDSNYAGITPTLVLSADEYIVRDIGEVLLIDVDDLFFYTNTHDLLVELRFDSYVSGNQRAVFTNDGGGYRAFSSEIYNGNDTATYNMFLEFHHQSRIVEYNGFPLENATIYYWRVRTLDSLGIWSPWTSASFKYEVLESVPVWSNLVETASPVELGESLSLSMNATHVSGINQVLIEFDGSNHTMMKSGDTFSYTWTPVSVGTLPYTAYLEPNSGISTTVSGSFEIVDTTAPTWDPEPADKVLIFGEALSYQLAATDLSGIADWTINDTTNFNIADGLLTNATMLAVGGYYLNVTVTDNEGNSVSTTFIIAVLELPSGSTTGPGQPTPVDGSILVIAALVGVIAILMIVIVFQRKTPVRGAS
ncbi:MAG: DNRLRE domain-containing protein [Candidatus Thorarchaeota archaeon]